jgi:hypothetical protein
MPGAISTARKSPLLFDRLSAAIGVRFFAGCLGEILPSSAFSTLITYAKDPLIRVLSIMRSIFFPRVAQSAHDGNSATDSESSRICTCEQCDGYLTAGCCKLNGWILVRRSGGSHHSRALVWPSSAARVERVPHFSVMSFRRHKQGQSIDFPRFPCEFLLLYRVAPPPRSDFVKFCAPSGEICESAERFTRSFHGRNACVARVVMDGHTGLARSTDSAAQRIYSGPENVYSLRASGPDNK